MTREQWLERFKGAYQELSDCTDEEADEAAAEFDGVIINPETDCAIESARQAWAEELKSYEETPDLPAVAD